MNKMITIVAAFVLATLSAWGQQKPQTLSFTDKNGVEIKDGAVYTVTALPKPDGWGGYLMDSELFVQSSSFNVNSIIIEFKTAEVTKGDVQICFPQNCHPMRANEEYTTNAKNMSSSSGLVSIQTKWNFHTHEDGKAIVTAQLKRVEKAGSHYNVLELGPKITIRFEQNTATGIASISSHQGKTFQIFDLNGRRLLKNATQANIDRLGKGVYVCKTLVNGKVASVQKIIK